jgi:hypothetical protein
VQNLVQQAPQSAEVDQLASTLSLVTDNGLSGSLKATEGFASILISKGRTIA